MKASISLRWRRPWLLLLRCCTLLLLLLLLRCCRCILPLRLGQRRIDEEERGSVVCRGEERKREKATSANSDDAGEVKGRTDRDELLFTGAYKSES